MRINLHENTPIKDWKKWRFIIVCFSIFLYCIPVLLACLFFIEAKAIVAGILTLALPAFLITILLRSFFRMVKSYAEFDDEKVTVVEFFAFRKKTTNIPRSELKQRKSESASYSPGRGLHTPRRFRQFLDFRYIVFRNAEGEYLFKILDTPEGNQWADKLMNNQ
ncbi:MAG: hypothetical protein E7530_01455 [Ruminococcaceae bacterium]|nr:hypothetical protein [Oscillospiraceae bacterium]